MDTLDKLFIFCGAISILVSTGFCYLIVRIQGWPLAILCFVIMVPLLLISGLSTSETMSKPFGKTSRSGELKVKPAIPVIMAVLYYIVITALLFFVFKFARLI